MQTYDKRKLKREFTLTIIMMAITAAVMMMAIYSFAWFANNRKVDAAATPVTVDSGNYELYLSSVPTENKYGMLRDIFNERLDYLALNGETELITSTSRIGIVADLQIDSQDPEPKLAPGTFGTVSFSVINSGDPVDNMAFGFDFYGAKNIGTEELPEYELVGDADIIRYAHGHILFFSGKTNGLYTGWLKDGFSIPVSSSRTDVTLYWIWPNTFRDMTSKNNNDAVIASADVDLIIADMWQYPDRYFSFTESHEVNEAFIANAGNFTILSGGYNNVDQILGSECQYLAVEIESKGL